MLVRCPRVGRSRSTDDASVSVRRDLVGRTFPVAATSAVLIVASALGTRHSFEARRNDLASASTVTEVRDVLADAGNVGVALVPSSADPSVSPFHQLAYTLAYQWYLPEVAMSVDLGLNDDVGPYVFSPSENSLLLPGAGVVIWEDPERKMALWKEIGD